MLGANGPSLPHSKSATPIRSAADSASVRSNIKDAGAASTAKERCVIRPVFSYGDSYLAGQHLLAGTPVGRVLYRIQDRDTGKWGFVNHLGNWAILPRYEDCHPYSFGEGINFASVQYRGKWGCINKKGEFVVKPVFSYGDSYLAGMEWQNSPDYAVVPASQVANYVPDGTDMNPQTTTARNLAEHAADTTVRTPAEDAAPPAAVTPPTVAMPAVRRMVRVTTWTRW